VILNVDFYFKRRDVFVELCNVKEFFINFWYAYEVNDFL